MESFNINAKSELGNPIAHFQIDKPLGVPYSKKFNNIDDAQDSPLVQKLFYLPFVKSVTLNNQSILIERFIYAESTPNPSVMKFVANKKLVETNVEYKNIEDAKGASLAIELFNLPYVKEVFVSENYISITKFDLTEWDPIIQEIRGLIVKGLEQKKVLFNLIKIDNSKSEVENTNLTDIDKKIISILDEYIQPAVASDGGSIVFDSYIPESQSVNVILQGACSGCPSSTLTLKNGIENMLKEMMPGLVENVTAING
jgi:Fe-S cluster biogenesis protein NfuA